MVKAVICKTNEVSSTATCPGGHWQIGAPSPTSTSSATYRTRGRDATTEPQTYFAFACDSSNGCSQSRQGSFQVTPGTSGSSDESGLEDFYAYRDWDVGSGSAFVNVATGNLVAQYRDLEVPGQGLNLTLVRTYNASRASADGPIGKGWSIGLAGAPSSGLGRGSVIEASPLTLVFDDTDGTRHTFVKQLGTWRSPPGVNLVVTDEADGLNLLYKVYRPDGVRFEIRKVDTEYRLTKVADRKGNELNFSYSNGVLATVTNTAGRSLTFTWTEPGGGFISRVRFSAEGSTADIDYSVNAATGQLDWVREFPSTSSERTTGFSYNTSGLSAITDGAGKQTTFVLDTGRVGSVTDREAKVWAFTYGIACGVDPGAARAVTCLTNPEGHNTTWITEGGNLIEYRDAGDVDDDGNARINARTYAWVDNRLRQAVDEAQNLRDYEYNQNGQLTSTRISGQGETPVITKFIYQTVSAGVADLVEGRAATTADGGPETPEERRWKFQYDASGNVIRETDPRGKFTDYAYHERGLLKSVTNPRGAVTQFGDPTLTDTGYHSSGAPRVVKDAKGHSTSLTYDFLGRVTKKTDREVKDWLYEYDLRGNLLKATDPLLKFVLHCYDQNDNQVLEVRPGATSANCALDGTDGWSTKKVFDGRELLTESKTASKGYDGLTGVQVRKTTFTYFPDGEMKEIFEPRTYAASPVTQTVTFTRYPNNRIKTVVDEEGKQTDIRHTPDGLLRTVIDPPSTVGRHFLTYTYTNLRKVKERFESGISSPAVYKYNLHGQVIAESTPMGRTTHHKYDKAGRLEESRNAAGHVTKMGYDDVGNLTSIDQPTGTGGRLLVSYTYNLKDELETETDPAASSHTIAYEYDKEGRQTFKKDKWGSAVIRAVKQVWWEDGRIKERDAQNYSGGNAVNSGRHRVVFGYDGQGNLANVDTYREGSTTIKLSSITAGYTSAGELKSIDEQLLHPSGATVTKSSSFTYHPDGLLASRSMDGYRTDYTYQLNGLESTTSDAGQGSVGGSFLSEYNDNGSLRKLTLENNAIIELAYDLADRITSQKVSRQGDPIPLSLWEQIRYDDDGNRLSEVVTQYKPDPNQPPNTGTGEYQYDKASRLIVAKHPFEKEAVPYALDDAGNVLSETGWIYTYSANRLTQKSPFPQSTHNPSLKSTYGFDQRGNRNSETDRTVNPGIDTAFAYDAADHTTSFSWSQGTSNYSVGYEYDGLNRQVRRTESPSNETRLFFRNGLSQQIALEADASAVKTRYILDSKGRPLAQVDPNKPTDGRGYFITDIRGNLTQLLSYGLSGASRGVQAVFSYDAYGRDKPAFTNTSGGDSRLRFQLAPRDPESGHHAIGPRMLDPLTYRFAGIDSAVDAGYGLELQSDPLTGNRYLYAGANPVNMIDDGHKYMGPRPDDSYYGNDGGAWQEKKSQETKRRAKAKPKRSKASSSEQAQPEPSSSAAAKETPNTSPKNLPLATRCLFDPLTCADNATVALFPLVPMATGVALVGMGIPLCATFVGCLAGGPLIAAGVGAIGAGGYLAYEFWFSPRRSRYYRPVMQK